MKKLFRLSIFLLLTSIIPITALGIKPYQCFTTVYKYSSYHENEDDPHRRPTPFQCTISRNEGVKISSITAEEIERYEIYDTSGACLGIFSDQDQFISSLFSRSGVFEVRFYTNDYLFIGKIEI